MRIARGKSPVGAFRTERLVACCVDQLNLPPEADASARAHIGVVDDEEVEAALVYPQDADGSAGKLSVFSGIGTTIPGYQEGDAFDWRISNRTCHIRIGKVLYQPEAAGDFHL